MPEGDMRGFFKAELCSNVGHGLMKAFRYIMLVGRKVEIGMTVSIYKFIL